jgi:hypothetical protein
LIYNLDDGQSPRKQFYKLKDHTLSSRITYGFLNLLVYFRKNVLTPAGLVGSPVFPTECIYGFCIINVKNEGSYADLLAAGISREKHPAVDIAQQ